MSDLTPPPPPVHHAPRRRRVSPRHVAGVLALAVPRVPAALAATDALTEIVEWIERGRVRALWLRDALDARAVWMGRRQRAGGARGGRRAQERRAR